MPWVLGPGNVGILVFVPSVVGGLVLSVLYAYRCFSRRCRFDLSVVVATFLQAGTAVSGVILMVNTVVAVLTSQGSPLALHVFIGGVTVATFAGKGAYQGVFRCQAADGQR